MIFKEQNKINHVCINVWIHIHLNTEIDLVHFLWFFACKIMILFQKLVTFHADSKAHWFQNSSMIWVYPCQCFLLCEKQHRTWSASDSCNPKQPWNTLYCRTIHRASPWAINHSLTQYVRKPYSLYSLSSPHSTRVVWYYNPSISTGTRNLE